MLLPWQAICDVTKGTVIPDTSLSQVIILNHFAKLLCLSHNPTSYVVKLGLMWVLKDFARVARHLQKMQLDPKDVTSEHRCHHRFQ